eukprot:TRINITY_DN2822_c0_g1_i3.p1 TRINITY_DN2822_c0_g1~~TRINITY_DN2822_c0_g1_i3.p1  ORF type:complete len:1238 (+),score=326.99 TRINITY_DN2822_c0_g1_i3:184-3714(+)
MGVSHVLNHDITEVRAVAWDPVRQVLVVAAGDTVWIIGQGWTKRRFRILTDDSEILTLQVQRSAPAVVVATPKKVNIIDYQTGITHLNHARDPYLFTSAAALISENWILVGRSDGIIQGLDDSASTTQLQFNLTNSCPHPEQPATVDPSVTLLLSRMFHKQVVIAHSQRTGLCQYNYIRNELLNRFACPKGSEIQTATMCAMDKYLVGGLKDGRISLWKTQDEPRNKRTFELPPMLIVPALSFEPVYQLECYGSGTEDVVPCRWLSGSRLVEGTLRPKEKMPTALTMQVVFEGPEGTGKVKCGLTGSGWPERTEMPSQVVTATDTDGRLQILASDDGTQTKFHSSKLSPLNSVSPVVSTVLIPAHRSELLALSVRSNVFPWNGGGRSQFVGDTKNAALLLGCGLDGSITLMKAILSRDAIAPHLLRALDICNASCHTSPGTTPLRGCLTPTHHGGSLLSCAGGHLHWVDMVTLQSTAVDLQGLKATCAEFVGAPLHRLFVGTADGKVAVLGGDSPVQVVVEGTSGTSEIISLKVSQVQSKWTIDVLFVNSLGATELAVLLYDPNAPPEAMDDPDGPLTPTAEGGAHSDPNSPGFEVVLPAPLPPRPLRSMGVYTVSSGASAGVPSLHVATHAKTSAPLEPASPTIANQVSNIVAFNKGSRTKPIAVPPTDTETVIVLRLSDSSLDNGDVQASLFDLSGAEFMQVKLSRAEKPGTVKVVVEWFEAPFAAERNVIQLAEADEVPLVVGEDTVLALCVAFEGASIAIFSSVDSEHVPTDAEVAASLQRYVSLGQKLNGGPMWALKEVHPLLVMNEKEVCQKSAVASATLRPENSLKGLQVFEDVTNPDAGTTAVLKCVKPDDEAAHFVPTVSQDHNLLAAVVVASTGTVHQVLHEAEPNRRRCVTLRLSAPLRIGADVVTASSVRLYAEHEVYQATLAFVVSGTTLHVVRLPIPESGAAKPLLSYTHPGVEGLSLDVEKGEDKKLHIIGMGDKHSLLHLIAEPSADGLTMYDIAENCEKQGPFKGLAKLPPRPQVKPPGMGLMTMKNMYKNHDKEVQQVDVLISNVVEETFDDFTSRILPDDQKKKMMDEMQQNRKELFGDAAPQESQSSQSAQTRAAGSAVSETKDIMDKNKLMLQERGEKLEKLADNTAKVQEESKNFLEAIKEHNRKQAAKKWWQL